jgi:predicted permease
MIASGAVTIVETLAPLVLLIGLGVVLSRLRFLGRDFMADLNRLVFWVAMPALLFHSSSRAGGVGGQTGSLVGVLIAGTVVVAAVAWSVSLVLRVPRAGRGTLIQAAFRGNLAFIGVPVMASTLPDGPAGAVHPGLTTAVIAMTLTMAFYNALAILVLQRSRSAHVPFDGWLLVRGVVTNPLLVSGLLGLAVALLGVPLPRFVDRTLETLAGAAVPVALLGIGNSLATIHMRGRRAWIIAAAALKVAVAPVIFLALSRVVGLGALEHRIALVFGACPTAAAAYIMAREMDGDEALASGSIALSTMLSVVSLAATLWLTDVGT